MPPEPKMPGFDPRQLYANSFSLGDADLVVGGATDQVVGRTAALCFLAFRDERGMPIFKGVTVVAPPLSAWNRSDDDILGSVLNGCKDFPSKPLDSEDIEYIRRRLTIRRCENLEARSLVAELAATSEQFIIVPMSHLYRDPEVRPTTHGRAAVLFPEDVWVPQVVAWAPKCIKAVEDSGSYLVLDLPESPPTNEANQDRLNAVENLYPAFLELIGETDFHLLISSIAQRLGALAAGGRVDEAIGEVERLEITPSNKALLLIQVLSRGPNPERTRRALSAYIALEPTIPPEAAVRLGRIAQRAGDLDTAKWLIAQGIESVSSQDLLEVSLISSTALADPQLAARIYHRLNALFPDSQELVQYREHLLLSLCTTDEGAYAADILSRIRLTPFETELFQRFQPATEVAISGVLDALRSKTGTDRDLGLLCCATYAFSATAPQDAIFFATPIANPGPFARRACLIIAAAVKRALLENASAFNDPQLYREPLAYIRHYVAIHPNDPQMREAFSSLFSVDAAGGLGLPAIVAQAIELIRPGVLITPVRVLPEPMASKQEVLDFLTRADTWICEKGVLDVTHTVMPTDVIRNDPEALLNALAGLIRYLTSNTAESDLDHAQHLAFVACSVAHHVHETTVDVSALRLVACGLITAGRSQKARDLAEQVLEVARDSAKRNRLAWSAFADIYHRSHSPIDALIGLACAFDVHQSISAEDAWWEIYTLFRIVRDIGLSSIALDLLRVLREINSHLSEPDMNAHRLDTLELSVRVIDKEARDLSSLERLVSDAARHCRLLLQSDDEILPALAVFAQAVSILEQAGGQAPSEVQGIMNTAFQRLSSSQAGYLKAVSSSHPTIEEAVYLYRRAELARNADDVPGDLRPAELTARRVLLADEGKLSAKEVSAAVELLSDHTLNPLEDARTLDAEWPMNFVSTLHSDGVGVLMLALDAKGILTALTLDAQGFTVRKRGTADAPFSDALFQWSTHYPYRYGIIDRIEGNNEFYVSMEKLDIPLPDAQRIIVICEPELQQIPFNLTLLDQELAGYSRAIGYVPSLIWLDGASKRPRAEHKRRVAWISEPSEEFSNSALAMVLSRTEPTLLAHGFEIDTAGTVPTTFADAQFAVIAAHGSIASDAYFHRISDEGHLTITPSALAHSLAGVEITILFVCSGGRTDKHPFVNTAVGLPKLLLSTGCRTVIASPWPLSPSVTGPWLESFMKAWDSGHTALDSTFLANKAVDEHFGSVPQYALAMTVHGDVLLRGCRRMSS